MTQNKPPPFTITPVRTPTDLAAIHTLFERYAASLPISLSFQSFATELSTLPGAYAPPGGELFLAHSTKPSSVSPIGCVAFRPLSLPNYQSVRCCEMKRLYVDPEARGMGLGKALVGRVLLAAREAGYEEIRLDTLGSMREAEKLYRGVGFGDVDAYYETPVRGTRFLGKILNYERRGEERDEITRGKGRRS